MAPILAAIPALLTTATTAAASASVPTLLTGAATALSAGGSILSGVQQKQASDAEAKALKTKGEQEVALAQRKALESRREKDRALGRVKAVAAASGGGTGGSVSEIMAGIEQRGEYNALMDMYNGLSARNDLRNEARVAKAEGKSALVGSMIDAGSTILKGGSTIYKDYQNKGS